MLLHSISFKGPSSVLLKTAACVQVPPELKDDLILIADKIEPYLQQVKDQADKIPEKAHELAAKIQPAAERLGDKIEQGAHKVFFLFQLVFELKPAPLDLSLYRSFSYFVQIVFVSVKGSPPFSLFATGATWLVVIPP